MTREHDDIARRLDALAHADGAALGERSSDAIAEDAGTLAALTARLDALAGAERSAPGRAFEERLLASAADVFAPAPIPFWSVRRLGAIGGLAAAAALAIVAGVWMTRGASTPAAPGYELAAYEQDVGVLLELMEAETLDGQLAEAWSDAERLEEGLDEPWSAFEDLAGSFATEAM